MGSTIGETFVVDDSEGGIMARKARRKVFAPKAERLGERVARLRKERALSQTELGERIGVVQRVVSHYENDELRIPAETLLRIADALKVSLYEILGRVQSPRPSTDRRLWKVLEKIESLPPRDQRAVVRHIDALARDASGRD